MRRDSEVSINSVEDSAQPGWVEPTPRESFVMPFQTGEILVGKYEVLELIGVGSIGFVVAARRIHLDDEVALKFLRSEYLANADLALRFAREARVAVRIKSEHVARVLDVGRLDSGVPFIVMERLEGRDLSRVLLESGPLPTSLAVEYVLQACEALATAHSCGIVHRDVKPANLFLTQRGDGTEAVKIVDFGISKVALAGAALSSTVPLAQTMAALGSPIYMSPEQVRARKNVDARSDVWALGCVLYELLAGAPAFDAPSLMQICAMILESEPRRLCDLAQGVPAELEAVVARCFQKEPRARFQDMAELAKALTPYAPARARGFAERCAYVLRDAPAPNRDTEDSDLPPRSRTGSNSGVAISLFPPRGSKGKRPFPRSSSDWKWAALLGAVVLVLAGVFIARSMSSAPDAVNAAGTSATHAAAPPDPVKTVEPPPSTPVEPPPRPEPTRLSEPEPPPARAKSPPPPTAKATPPAPKKDKPEKSEKPAHPPARKSDSAEPEPDVGF